MSYLLGFQAHKPIDRGPTFGSFIQLASALLPRPLPRSVERFGHTIVVSEVPCQLLYSSSSIQLSLHRQSFDRYPLATFSKCHPRSLHRHLLIRLSLRRLLPIQITRRRLPTFSVSAQPSLKICFIRKDWRNLQRNGVSQARGEFAYRAR